jgi:hypothetical protein
VGENTGKACATACDAPGPDSAISAKSPANRAEARDISGFLSRHVISRTSTANLGARPGNLPKLAEQLGVANILEGSVQRRGDAVRVNVQLIKASTDEHLWAEIYDRKMDDIFAVQSEIAIAIAQALSATVTGTEKKDLAAAPTESPPAPSSTTCAPSPSATSWCTPTTASGATPASCTAPSARARPTSW